jgi:hypothetical protein
MGAFSCAISLITLPILPVQAAIKPQPDARAIMMAEFLSKAQHRSVTVHGAYDALQPQGDKVEWNEVRTVTLSRPDNPQTPLSRSCLQWERIMYRSLPPWRQIAPGSQGAPVKKGQEKMKLEFWCPSPAISLVVVFLGLVVQGASARGGRGGGGFSRESPAAGGSFSSHSGAKPEPQGSAQSSHQQYASSAQSSRQQYGSNAQSSREQTTTGMHSSAQQYHGAYPYAASTNWAAGVGLAAAATTGVAVGTGLLNAFGESTQ